MSKVKATEEITKWLDYKRVKENTREAQKAQIDVLVEAMQAGELSLSDNKLCHKLSFPVSELDLDELTYKPRITIGELQKVTANVKATDFDGKITAYIAALTGQGISHIQKLDTSDYAVGQAIAVFFM